MITDHDVVLTNAPAEYDYGYTIPVRMDVNLDLEQRWLNRGWRIRVVHVPTSHVDYQCGRYASGLYWYIVADTYEACRDQCERLYGPPKN